MPFFAGGISPVHAKILFAQPARPPVRHWPGGEGILLSGLPAHLAEGRCETLPGPIAHGTRLFYGGSGSLRGGGKRQARRQIEFAPAIPKARLQKEDCFVLRNA